jgi:hypothetical protein
MRNRADIYCLHITTRKGDVHHYIGATKRGRFPDRLREHRTARGSVITRELALDGAQIEGCVIHANTLAEEEIIYQSTIPLMALCPMCRSIDKAAFDEATRQASKKLAFSTLHLTAQSEKPK